MVSAGAVRLSWNLAQLSFVYIRWFGWDRSEIPVDVPLVQAWDYPSPARHSGGPGGRRAGAAGQEMNGATVARGRLAETAVGVSRLLLPSP